MAATASPPSASASVFEVDGKPYVWATFSAPTNIACIKYWGKRDKVLNLPINSSGEDGRGHPG